MADIWAALVLSAGTAAWAGQHVWAKHQRGRRHAQLTTQRLARGVTRELEALAQRTQTLEERIQIARQDLLRDLPGAREARVGLDLLSEFHARLLTELQGAAAQATGGLELLRGRRLASRQVSLLALRAQIRTVLKETDERQLAWDEGDRAWEADERTARNLARPRRGMGPVTGAAPRPEISLVWNRG